MPQTQLRTQPSASKSRQTRHPRPFPIPRSRSEANIINIIVLDSIVVANELVNIMQIKSLNLFDSTVVANELVNNITQYHANQVFKSH